MRALPAAVRRQRPHGSARGRRRRAHCRHHRRSSSFPDWWQPLAPPPGSPAAAAVCGWGDEAAAAHIRRGEPPDAGYGDACLRWGRRELRRLREQGYAVGPAAHAAAAARCGERGDPAAAAALVRDCPAAGPADTLRLQRAVLLAHANAGDLAAVNATAAECGEALAADAARAALYAAGRCGDAEAAAAAWARLHAPDASAVCSLAAAQSDAAAARQVLEREGAHSAGDGCRSLGLAAVLAVCVRGGDGASADTAVEEAARGSQLFAPPVPGHWAQVLAAHARSGAGFKGIAEAWRSMGRSGCAPTAPCYRVVLLSCAERVAAPDDVWCRLADRLFRRAVQARQDCPRQVWTPLMRLYAACGATQQTVALRERLRNSGRREPLGFLDALVDALRKSGDTLAADAVAGQLREAAESGDG
eukprot:TRINITY_DN5396_c0_g1_i2.p1 TRINITY_DN5396_c0_g1~~TRINITY_DN5396_c0_g1_i2.p1  ORF type:complete len:418 (+),score=115.72 TRINITY_DN5396_c0_g1_i2:79-1332(+)